ncbi:hypothetical protein QOZ88_19185 [Blastococcus sp. BMG 814]|uniref:CorA-like Mg2+ transporter protein n=1 Tax=Blastococcus carthaginiensis TaxID=3050034 RepID=A0ABT9II25_9ACTN|nr:hypothetical protein [Blastococcus carthaginiensis]MDP5184764.1 hypothetical protein [Blastococcus carthaginiensis]
MVDAEIAGSSLVGDAHLVLLAPIDLTRPLTGTDQSSVTAVQHDALAGWDVAPTRQMVAALRGSLTYVDAEQDQIVELLRAGPGPLADLQTALEGALPSTVDPGGFRVLTCEAIVLAAGQASLRVILMVDRGWDTGEVLAAFGATVRDATCDAIRGALLPLIRELHEACLDCAPDDSLDVPYFHLMYGGTAPSSVAEAGRADVLRTLVYPPDAGVLPNHSPRSGEFVFLGYGFSLVVCSNAGTGRLWDISVLVSLCSTMFRRFERVCDAVDANLRDEAVTCDRQALLRLQEAVQVEYEDLRSPSFVYRHEFLVMREELLQAWQVDRLSGRSRTLLGLLGSRVGRLDREQSATVARKLEILLFAVAAMSIISVAGEARSLVLDEAWVTLSVVAVIFCALMVYAVKGVRR